MIETQLSFSVHAIVGSLISCTGTCSVIRFPYGHSFVACFLQLLVMRLAYPHAQLVACRNVKR
jgi:hypothetical protein